MRNLITDVPGVLVGNADDAKLASGVTAIVFEEPADLGLARVIDHDLTSSHRSSVRGRAARLSRPVAPRPGRPVTV